MLLLVALRPVGVLALLSAPRRRRALVLGHRRRVVHRLIGEPPRVGFLDGALHGFGGVGEGCPAIESAVDAMS